MMRNAHWLVLWMFASGCVGAIGDDGGGNKGKTLPEGSLSAASLPMNRLSTSEYDRTVRDLLQLDPADLMPLPSAGFPADDIIEKYAVGYTVSALEVERAEAAAERLGNLAMKHPERIVPCDPTPDEDACANAFIDAFGKRAYRRPLTDDEKAELFATFQFGKANGTTFYDGAELVVQTALLSPHFLFHVPELGDASSGDTVDVTDWEMASRLSYFLWGTMPDDALFEAAENGDLRTEDDIAAQAERMLDDARAHQAIGGFLEQTFEPSKIEGANRDPAIYPEFSPAVATSMASSYRTFLDDAFWQGGTFDDFFGSRKVFVDQTIAPILGFDGVTGDVMVAVDAPADQRLGILTQPGFLTLKGKFDRSDPIHRGVFILKSVLCRSLGDPPANASSTPADPDLPKHTTREQIEAKTADVACQGCHGSINPLGFGLESFDALGRFRTSEATDIGDVSVDPSGTGAFDGEAETSWSSALDLATDISTSREARRCFAQNLYRFANPRGSVADDDAKIDDITDGFVDDGESMHSLVMRVVASPAFTKRLVP